MDKDETQDIDLENNDVELDLNLDDGDKDWKAEALKYKSMASRYKTKLGTQEKKPDQKENISDRPETKPSDILKADEFKLYRQGYSESEIDLIMHNGGMKALSDEKSPLALGLKVAREQRTAEEAAEQVSDKAGTSEVERKFTVEQMRNMKADELANLIGYANSN